jgi:hypothetical protein
MVKSGYASWTSHRIRERCWKEIHPSVIEEHLRKLPEWSMPLFRISATRNEELVAYVVGSESLSRQSLKAIAVRVEQLAGSS